MSKFYGNLVLMTVICIVIFWIFMALHPAHAGYFGGGPGKDMSGAYTPPPSIHPCSATNSCPRPINISPKTGRTYSPEADYFRPQRRSKRK